MAEIITKEGLYKTLDAVTARLVADEQFVKRIERASISMLLEVSDIDASYGIFLNKGEIKGEADPEEKTSFAVVARAETIDKLLSGKLSGESAYMSGAIRLRGNEWTAESMIGHMPFITRAYKAVTE